MGVRERLNALQDQIDILVDEIDALKKDEKPIFVDLERAARLCSVSSTWLRYRAQTAQMAGVACKTKVGRGGGKWLFHLPRLERYILAEGKEEDHGSYAMSDLLQQVEGGMRPP